MTSDSDVLASFRWADLTEACGSLKLLQQILLEEPQSYSYFPKVFWNLGTPNKKKLGRSINFKLSLKQ